jgi:hypothetical protein
MESRQFIITATRLKERMRFCAIGSASYEEENEKRAAIQKELNQALGTLQNPTLPSAESLVSVALDYNFQVDPRVISRLKQAESCWAS